MNSLKGSRLALLALIIAAGCGLAQNTGARKAKASPNEVRTALAGGHPVLLVVRPSVKADDASESYADWAEYLNAFAAKEKSLKVLKLSRERYSELVTDPRISKPYNTLFLRDADHALLYRGMILEPAVYSKGKAFMTGKDLPASAQTSGLEIVQIKLRP